MPLKVNTDYEVNKFTNKVDKKLDIEPPSYAKTLDWLASKNLIVHVYSYPCWHRGENEYCTTEFDVTIHDEKKHEVLPPSMNVSFKTWQEAADYGIDKTLELLNDETKTD